VSNLCSGSQDSAAADWVGEFAVTVHYVMWWRVSTAGHKRGRKKGFVTVYFAYGIIVFVTFQVLWNKRIHVFTLALLAFSNFLKMIKIDPIFRSYNKRYVKTYF
jgi:uncharacterized membrane protein